MPVARSEEDVTQPSGPSNAACQHVHKAGHRSTGSGPGVVEKFDFLSSQASPAGPFTLESLTFKDVTKKKSYDILS